MLPIDSPIAVAAVATAVALAATLRTFARATLLSASLAAVVWLVMVVASTVWRDRLVFLVLWPILAVAGGTFLPNWPTRLLLGAALAVAWFSGGQGSVGESDSWLARVLNLSPETAHALIVALRKGVHFVFYGVVAALAAQAARLAGNPRRYALLAGLAVAALLGTFDEGRQSLIPYRSGSPWDVLLNLAGALTLSLATQRKEER